MAMLLAGTFVSADTIISNAWKDMREQPWHRPELQYSKPPDLLCSVVEKAARAQKAIAVEQHQQQRKMCQLFGKSFITLESSWNEDMDPVQSDIKKCSNLFETKPNRREKKEIKKSNKKERKRKKSQTCSNKSGSQFEKHLMSCVGPLNTSTMTNGELHKLRILLSNLQTPSCDETPSGGFDIILDSGTTWNVTYSENDFIDTIKPVSSNTTLSGIARALPVTGVGTLEWNVVDDSGQLRSIRGTGYLVKDLKLRLCSPQSYFQEQMSKLDTEDGGELRIRGRNAVFQWANGQQMTVPYHARCNLPIAYGYSHGQLERVGKELQSHICLADQENINLSSTQKQLLRWHYRLGHIGFQWLQSLAKLGRLGLLEKFSRCIPPLCTACQVGQGKRQSPSNPKRVILETREGGENTHIKANDLLPGQRVSVDQYVSKVKGRTIDSFGLEPDHEKYCGGTIYCDHGSQLLHVGHQTSLRATDTVRSTKIFERMALSNGVAIQGYHGDNGIFTAQQFEAHLLSQSQTLKLSGVGAHHQNGVAERAIGLVVARARTMMLHAALHWPEVADTQLWPMALSYSVHLWNITPRLDSGFSPLEVFTGNKQEFDLDVRTLHVWGCPAYVLDPVLQDGKKLPKWKPRARRGVFVGKSERHASSIGNILNLVTKSISPQFHVVYDDYFTTTYADGSMEPDEWKDLLSHSRDWALEDEASRGPELTEEWLDEQERASQRIEQNIRTGPTMLPEMTGGMIPSQAKAPSVESRFQRESQPTPWNLKQEFDVSATEGVPALPAPMESKKAPAATVKFPIITRSGRVSKPPQKLSPGKGKSYFDAALSFLNMLPSKFVDPRSHVAKQHAFLESLLVDPETDFVDGVHPLGMAAKGSDLDTLTYHEAMACSDANKFREAMAVEIKELEGRHTWNIVPRPANVNILPGTWSFKRKRYPDGRIRKYKARYCVRGDKQLPGVDFFDTFAPVVAWSTIRLMLTLTAVFDLKTKQVDYTNAFAQTPLKDDVYIALPKDFDSNDNNSVLKLNTSLYGMRQSPLMWYEHLKAGLEKRGFKPSTTDQCLFLGDNIICVVYVDDCLFFARDSLKIEAMITDLQKDFSLEPEEDVEAFLGIQICRTGNHIEFTQPGLIDRILLLCGMENCNTKATPADETPLGTNKNGAERVETWNYSSAVGMLLYLASNARPDIMFAVHQCARFTHCAKHSHEEGIKRICRYLQGTKDKGLIFTTSADLALDCYADADFAGLWGQEDDQDPVCVKSRTGYVLLFGGCPLLWVSKLQTEIALSTMEAEYVALSQSMRDVLPMRIKVEQVLKQLNVDMTNVVVYSTAFEDNNGALILATTKKMTPRSKHIAIKYHHFKQAVYNGFVKIVKVNSEKQLADIFTKGLGTIKFQANRLLLCGW